MAGDRRSIEKSRKSSTPLEISTMENLHWRCSLSLATIENDTSTASFTRTCVCLPMQATTLLPSDSQSDGELCSLSNFPFSVSLFLINGRRPRRPLRTRQRVLNFFRSREIGQQSQKQVCQSLCAKEFDNWAPGSSTTCTTQLDAR